MLFPPSLSHSPFLLSAQFSTIQSSSLFTAECKCRLLHDVLPDASGRTSHSACCTSLTVSAPSPCPTCQVDAPLPTRMLGYILLTVLSLQVQVSALPWNSCATVWPLPFSEPWFPSTEGSQQLALHRGVVTINWIGVCKALAQSWTLSCLPASTPPCSLVPLLEACPVFPPGEVPVPPSPSPVVPHPRPRCSSQKRQGPRRHSSAQASPEPLLPSLAPAAFVSAALTAGSPVWAPVTPDSGPEGTQRTGGTQVLTCPWWHFLVAGSQNLSLCPLFPIRPLILPSFTHPPPLWLPHCGSHTLPVITSLFRLQPSSGLKSTWHMGETPTPYCG